MVNMRQALGVDDFNQMSNYTGQLQNKRRSVGQKDYGLGGKALDMAAALGDAYNQYQPPETALGMMALPAKAVYGLGQGAVTAIEDFVKDPSDPKKSFDAASIVAGGGGLLSKATGVPAGSIGMFAGRMAKTADQNKLKQAEKMIADGKNRDEVWKETGWFKDADGQMKFEIDDSSAVTNPIKKKGRNYMPDALTHPEIYKAYPELKNTSIALRTKNHLNSAFYPPAHIKIGQMTDEGRAKPKTVLELNLELDKINAEMSVIQDAQPRGRWDAESLKSPEYQRIQELKAEFKKKIANFKKPPKGNTAIPNKPVTLHELQHNVQDIEGFAEGGSASSAGSLAAYRRLAGEVEARNVEKRMDYPMQQRIDEAPWTTLDVPENKLIFRGNGNNKPMTKALMPK